MFTSCDCTMVEVNPLAETADGQLVAADAKIGFDDNAAYRQKDIFAMRDESQIDPREVRGRAALAHSYPLFSGLALSLGPIMCCCVMQAID